METKTIKLHKYQDLAIFSDKRFVALIAGIQSGKTISGAIWARKQFNDYPQDNGLICAPTYKILTQSTLPKFFEINPDLKKFYKKGDNEIEIPGMGKIFVRSTENPNVIEGMTLRWIWSDEAGQMKLDAWINFQGRLSILQGKLFITSTPYTLNWLYSDFYQQWKNGNSDYEVVQFKSIDNPYFPKEEYERAKKTMDIRTFRRRYEGLFEKMSGLVYDDFDVSRHIVEPQDIKFKEIICGIDWGFNDPTALVFIGINDGKYYVIDEYYKTGKTTDEIIEVLKQYQSRYNIRFFYPDPAEPDRILSMRKNGLIPREVIKNKDSITNGINTVRELIRTNRLLVFKNCVHTIEEFMTYCYSEDEADDKPIDENNHSMDSLRYAIKTYNPVTPIILGNTQVKRFI